MLHLESLTRNLLKETLGQINRQAQGDSSKAVLAIITGAKAGSEEAFMVLRTLRARGYWVTLVASKGAVELFSFEALQSKSQANRIIVQAKDVTTGELIKNHQYIIIPILSSSSLGKLVNGIWDTYPLYLIYQTLLQERQAVAAINSCLPTVEGSDTQSKLGTNAKIIKLISENKIKAQELGITWVEASHILEHIPAFAQEMKSSYNQQAFKAKQVLDKKVITLEDIKGLQFNQIQIKPGTIITPLAKDYAKETGITLVIKER